MFTTPYHGKPAWGTVAQAAESGTGGEYGIDWVAV